MLDYAIAKAVNSFGQGTVIDYLSGLMSSKALMVAAAILIALLILKYDKKKGKVVFVAILVALLAHFLITELVVKEGIAGLGLERTRPYLAYPGEIVQIGYADADSSFPSGHLSSLTAFLFVIMFYYRKNWVWIISIFAILLMIFSRMHNGMHYPSDALGGIVFGAVYSMIGVKISGYFEKKKIVKK